MKVKSKKNKKETEGILLGVAWYSRDQWARLLSAVSDRASFEEDYDDWVRMAKKAILDIRRTGLNPVKVLIDVEELINWCLREGRAVDGQARAEFANVKLMEQYEKKGPMTV